MCDLAPEEQECTYDGFDCIFCRAHKLRKAMTELNQSIPIIGKFIPDFHCPDFEGKEGSEE